MFCKMCGAENMDGAQVCSKCGAAMNGNQMYGNQMYGNQMYGNQMYGNQMYGNQMYGNQMNGNQMYGNQTNGNQMYGNKMYGKQAMMAPAKRKRINILGIIVSLIAIAALFVPYTYIEYFGESLSAPLIKCNNFYVFVIIIVLGLVFALLNLNVCEMITGIVLALFVIYGGAVKAKITYGSGYSVDLSEYAHKEIGWYILVGVAVAYVIAGIIGLIITATRKNQMYR